jgi:hypothetical protein
MAVFYKIVKLVKNGENYKLEALKSDTPFYQHIGILKHLKAVAKFVIFIIINSQPSNSKKKRPYKNILLSTRYFYIMLLQRTCFIGTMI